MLVCLFVVVTLVNAAYSAASECPDPNLRQTAIGGDTINAVVLLKGQPLTSALVRLYFAPGKTAWVGETDKNGKFVIKKLSPGVYDIDVHGWGRASITLNPERDKDFPQRGSWSVLLLDNTCISWGFVTN